MFGGAGVFCDGLMFALIADDMLYLKSDAGSQAAFEAEGLAPFSYATRSGRNTIMSYRRAPERVLDDPDEMLAWGRLGLAAARRAAHGSR
jgi:DNA transformation protein